jgi:GTP-binding protein
MSARAEDDALPLLSLIGRPNVGKSSLFNRLVGGQPAMVEDQPGITRDRRYGICDWGTARFRVVDTGGLDPLATGILAAMRQQTLRALDEADVVAFVVDARDGVTAVDSEVAKLLRKSGKPVVVAANKVDREGAGSASEAYSLGFDQVFPISASHGRGISDLLDAVVPRLPKEAAKAALRATPAPRRDDENRPIRIAFVGKPNVGKSSLVNCLLGEERVLVHDAPGTTMDPIDTSFSFGGREYVLVDTAGMRRRRSIDTRAEHVSAAMARDQIDRCDVAVLVIDAREAATAEDARLAGEIEASGRGALIVLNKKDLVGRKDIDAKIKTTKEALAFLAYAPVTVTSAVTRAGVTGIVTEATRIFAEASKRVSTGALNKLLADVVARQPPPAGPAGRHVRLYFATQASVRPPTVFISTNHAADIGHSYRRFLVNQLRKAYGFEGTPVRLVFRAHAQKKRGGVAAAAAFKRDTKRARSR